MTMEEAQEILQEIKHYLIAGNPVWDVDEIAEACDMAIEALRNEINCVKCAHYTERETYTGIKGVCKMDTVHMGSLISRQDAIDAFGLSEKTRKYGGDHSGYDKMMLYEIQDVLESLPSAEPKTGEWIEAEVIPEVYDIEGVKTWGSKMQCDQCGFRFMAVEGHIRQYNYCPNCGAKMERREP